MRLLDLFSGLGGFSLAGHRVGMNTVAFSEIEKFPCRVLAERFPGVPNLGDIAKIDGEEVVEKYGPVDIVTFGSPCQDLSVAGKRAGFAGERSGLFHEAIRVIAGARPAYAVWENVPGAMSSNSGQDFGAALDALADIGALDISWRVLDARYFGVPQRRRRVFVVADFRGERASEILLESEGVQRDLEAGGGKRKEAAAGVGGGAPFTFDERNVTSKVNRTRVGPGLPCGTLHEQPMSVVEPNQVPTLNSGMAVRRLMPLEAERLQGYPDGWTNLKGAADGPRYKALGNSFAVPVVEWILGRVQRRGERCNFPTTLTSLVRRCRRGHEWLPTSNPKTPCPFCGRKTPRVTKANFATINSHSMAGVNNDWMRPGGDALRRAI